MDILPEELLWNIFTFYEPSELVKLYHYNDFETNKILNNNIFWFWYFKTRGLPIFNNGSSFIEWISEYYHVEKSINDAIYTIETDTEFGLSSVKPVKVLLDFKNQQLNSLILKSYESTNYIVICVAKIKDKLTMYTHDYWNDKEADVIISEDYNTILNTVIKLIYYNLYPEIM